MDAANFTFSTWKNLILTYRRTECLIDAFMPTSRRNNTYFEGLQSVTGNRIQGASGLDDLRLAFGGDRYHKLNLESCSRHRTVEFRRHSGVTNFTKMENWIHFIANMITFAQHTNIATGAALANLPFLTDDQKNISNEELKN